MNEALELAWDDASWPFSHSPKASPGRDMSEAPARSFPRNPTPPQLGEYPMAQSTHCKRNYCFAVCSVTIPYYSKTAANTSKGDWNYSKACNFATSRGRRCWNNKHGRTLCGIWSIRMVPTSITKWWESREQLTDEMPTVIRRTSANFANSHGFTIWCRLCY